LEDAEVLTKLLATWISPSDTVGAAEELLVKLNKTKNENKLTEIYQKLAEPGISSEQKAELTRELNKILLEKRKI